VNTTSPGIVTVSRATVMDAAYGISNGAGVRTPIGRQKAATGKGIRTARWIHTPTCLSVAEWPDDVNSR